MYLLVPDLVSAALAEKLCAALVRAQFVDGGATAGPANRVLKNNLELADPTQIRADLIAELVGGMRTNRQLGGWAMPRHSAPLLFNRYDAGMYYRDHVDNAIGVADRQFHRSDLSLTIFLSPPDSYDGGELVLDTDGDQIVVKLPAGHAVVYANGMVHRVNPVTRGTRFAAVSWIESLIRDHEERLIVAELAAVRDSLPRAAPAAVHMAVGKSVVGLTRMFTG